MNFETAEINNNFEISKKKQSALTVFVKFLDFLWGIYTFLGSL